MQKFTDNARALLASSILATDTTLTVEAGKADRFPVANTVAWGTLLDWFKCVLIDSSGNREVIKVGVRTLGSGVFSNILRAQDGTAALAFTAGSVAVCAITAADIQNALIGSFGSLVSASTLDVAGKMRQNGVEGRFTPVGGIIMWSGSIAGMPAGWALCDGTLGTPDLRDRFVMGAGLAHVVGAVGGSKDSVAIAHVHGATLTGTSGVESALHTHGVSDPGHAHTVPAKPNGTGGGPLAMVDGASPITTSAATDGAFTGVTLGTQTASHTHALSVSGNTNSTGVAGTDLNLPPYYALAFIMCLAA